MVPRENKNNAYAKFWRENKEYYGIFESGLFDPTLAVWPGHLVTKGILGSSRV